LPGSIERHLDTIKIVTFDSLGITAPSVWLVIPAKRAIPCSRASIKAFQRTVRRFNFRKIVSVSQTVDVDKGPHGLS
jgi:hypothetical protein